MNLQRFAIKHSDLRTITTAKDIADFFNALPPGSMIRGIHDFPGRAVSYIEVEHPIYVSVPVGANIPEEEVWDLLNRYRNPSVSVNGWNNPPVVINANPGYTLTLPAGYNLGANNITINGKIKTNPSNGNPYYFVSDDNDVPASTVPSARCDCGAAAVGGGHSGWCSSN